MNIRQLEHICEARRLRELEIVPNQGSYTVKVHYIDREGVKRNEILEACRGGARVFRSGNALLHFLERVCPDRHWLIAQGKKRSAKAGKEQF